MEIKETAGAEALKINLSILPNGLNKTGEEINCGFSLLIGFNAAKDVKGKVNFKAEDLTEKLFDIVNNSVKYISLDIQGVYSANPFKDSFITCDHIDRWKRLLSDNSFQINGDAVFSQKIDDDIEKAEALFGPLLDEDDSQQSIYNYLQKTYENKGSGIYQALNGSEIKAREYIYEAISNKGYSNALLLSRKKANPGDPKDLIKLFNSIYQHPAMARYYGLIYDFNIPLRQLKNYFSDKPGNNENNAEITLTLKENDLAAWFESPMDASGGPGMHILDKITVFTSIVKSTTANIATKYYHGLAAYGIIEFNAGEVHFSTNNPDHASQRKFQVSSVFSKVLNEGTRLLDFSETQRKVTDGIYAFLKSQEDRPLRDLSSTGSSSPGILGQSVAVKYKNRENEDSLYSLCMREAVYDPVGKCSDIRTLEEGWIHSNIIIEGLNGNYNTQTLFHWVGHNLCVPMPSSHQDQKFRKSEKEEYGGLEGDNTTEESRVLRDKGFTFSFKLVPGSELHLVAGRSYSFLIRNVLSNGYTMPLKKNGKEFELTIEDLNSLGKANKFWLGPVPFNLDEDPINPPGLLGNKVFEKAGEKNSDSSNNIIIRHSKDKNFRWVFPPRIELQFAHYLGLLTKDGLKAESLHEYKSRGKDIVERSKNKLPEKSDNGKINYLADIRGRNLTITPADWITRMHIQKPIVMNNIFNFNKDSKTIFDEIGAGIISLKALPYNKESDEKMKYEIAGNKITLFLDAGLMLKFHCHLHGDTKLSMYNSLDGNIKALSSLVLLDENNLPQYAKGELYVTNAIAKPAKPVIGENNPKVIRLTKPGNLHKIFFEFSLKDFNPRAVQKLQIISRKTFINDDSYSIPDEETLSSIRCRWDETRKGKDHDLLNNEYPSSVFEQTTESVEPEVYKNNFGFSIRLNDKIFKSLNEDKDKEKKIVEFNIGNNFTVNLKSTDLSKAKLYDINDQPLGESVEIDLSKDSKILFSYDTKAGNDVVSLNFSITYNGKEIYRKTDTADVPYTDLSEKNLGLMPKIEQLLFSIHESTQAYFNYIHNEDYFIYRAEDSTGYIKKDIRVAAISRFQEYYPKLSFDKMVSEPSEIIHLEINNNIKPNTPVFQITPLMFHKKSKELHQRSMHLMFEIDRPLANGEKFAIILDKKEGGSYISDKFTSSIGRDLTSIGKNFTKTLAEYIDNSSPDFLAKYLASPGFSEITIDKTTYRVLLLEPFYEAKKNKWITVIGLDQNKLRDGESGTATLNSYNPFLRIIAAKYIKPADGNDYSRSLSDFSMPKYINILTERSIQAKREHDFWTITVTNPKQIKSYDIATDRSYFVALLREKPDEGILGNVVNSVGKDDPKQEEKPFHVIKPGQYSIRICFQRRKLLCVYEFETFDNTIENSDNTPWFDESKARLIYSEEFE